jgi:hypothetical protein
MPCNVSQLPGQMHPVEGMKSKWQPWSGFGSCSLMYLMCMFGSPRYLVGWYWLSFVENGSVYCPIENEN